MPAPLTATRPGAGAMIPIYTHTVQQRVAEVVDLARKPVPIMAALESMGMIVNSRVGYEKLMPIITNNETPITPYGSGVSVPAFFGGFAGSMRREYATSVFAVGYEHQDVLTKMTSPEATIELASFRTYQGFVALGQDMEADFVGGNASNALRMTGLEQVVHATTHHSSITTLATLLAADDWKLRQCGGTVQGIARTAMSGPNTGGPALLNNTCLDYSALNIASGSRRFGVSSGELNDVCQAFEHFFSMTTRGAEAPDMIWSTQRPMSDARRAGQAFISFVVTDNENTGANIGPGGLKYGPATWYAMPTLRFTGLNGGLGVAGEDSIYLLNSNHIGIEFDEEHSFKPMFDEWQVSHSPLGYFQNFEHRYQLAFDAPGYCGVAAKYGT